MGAVTEYRVVQTGVGFKVEISRPGEFVQVAAGFRSADGAEAWIAEDRQIARIDALQAPAPPLKMRES
jgi:hypothetical protein